MPIVAFLILATAGMLAVFYFFTPETVSVEAISAEVAEAELLEDPDALMALIFKQIESLPVSQRLGQSPGPVRIGIIAGHRQSDSGTECSDGLTEVQVNNGIAENVAIKLREFGISAETLDEFDPRLDGYFATALISIHADSCDPINDLTTGFKISGSPYTDSGALSICMQQRYGEATNLPYHPNSITPHMEEYHAFRKLSPGTPGLIIEVGFLNLDRQILTEGSATVVQGLVDGILCYVQQVR
jgi:N-acetylmuramoyl-L-alanine amidase